MDYLAEGPGTQAAVDLEVPERDGCRQALRGTVKDRGTVGRCTIHSWTVGRCTAKATDLDAPLQSSYTLICELAVRAGLPGRPLSIRKFRPGQRHFAHAVWTALARDR